MLPSSVKKSNSELPTSTANPDYIYVLNLDASTVRQLKENDLSFRGARMTLDYEERCMVLKVMPYIQHEQIASLFSLHITHELEAMAVF